MTELLIKVKDVDVVYDKKVILHNVNLNIREGEITCVVGPSGAGKSSLLRQILGVEKPEIGTIHVDGNHLKGPNRHIGYVAQDSSIFPNMTAIKNVMQGIILDSTPFLLNAFYDFIGFFGLETPYIKSVRKEAMKYLEMVNMEKHANKFPFELSGGQKQRVAIVAALIMKPKAILMDESFSALDPQTKMELRETLVKLQKEHNITIMFVTHDLTGDVPAISTRLIALTKYYEGGEHIGAKIAFDEAHPLLGQNLSMREKMFHPETEKWIKRADRECFQEHIKQHISEFSLNHPDSIK